MMRGCTIFLAGLFLLTAATLPAQEAPKKFKHTRGCPGKCGTCETALGKALGYLAKEQQGDGSWKAGNGGTVVVTSVATLALMASGSTPSKGPYAGHIQKAVTYILKTVAPGHKGSGKSASGQAFQGFGNWDLGFAALLLGEYALHVKSTELSTKIDWLIEKIRDNREPNGGWGHAKNFAYKDLVVASTACLAGLGALKIAGFEIPKDVVAEGVKYYEDSSAGGTVGYSPRQGQKGFGKAGRASGAAFAMHKLGVQTKFRDLVVKFIQQNIKTIPEDHASPTLHYLFGGLYARVLGGKYWAEYKGLFLDLWLSAQKEDGSFQCPTESDVKKSLGMDVDGLVGPNWPTAVFCLVFQLPLEETHLPDNKIRKSGGATATKGGLGLKKRKKPEPKKEEKGDPWLGVRVKNSGFGLSVLEVLKESPAAAAGLREGDLIVSYNGKTFDDLAGLRRLIAKTRPGQKVRVTILRTGDKKDLPVTLGSFPKRKGTATGEGEEI